LTLAQLAEAGPHRLGALCIVQAWIGRMRVIGPVRGETAIRTNLRRPFRLIVETHPGGAVVQVRERAERLDRARTNSLPP
ncbi:hypothetical protein, partial [Aquisphaera insulae]|uniref:hypothetical protein n=1 Tax=Aquisphaera insulae TaxID=2712864 RepID=UPI00196A9DE5